MKINYSKYIQFYKQEDVQKDIILLEGGQGKNINGNMFHFLKELCTNKKWNKFKIYYVVTKETINSAKKRMKFYDFHDVNYVIRESIEYLKLLATAKYLFNDNSFPPYFIKKPEQIYLNTWHGTPLKILGRQDIKNSSSFANVQKNYLMADYGLFPNKYTRDIFLEDYSLKNIVKQKILLADYPRNTAFFNTALKNDIKAKYSLNNKQVFAYLPTWRGSSRNANIQKQKNIVSQYLSQIDQKLTDNQVLYVNLHFLIGNEIDMSKYKHVKIFPSEYETYDFLNVCDVLITDYSSVFFDYAITGKKIILFTYDLEEYIAERGMYFPIEDLPFPRVDNVEDLINELNNQSFQEYSEFQHVFCEFTHQNTTNNILELIINNKNQSLRVEEYPYNGKDNEFICVNSLSTMNQKALILDYFKNCNDEKNYILCFNGKLSKKMIEIIENLPKNVQLFGFVSKTRITKLEKIVITLSLRSTIMNKYFKKYVDCTFDREALRRFYHIRVNKIIEFYNLSAYFTREIERLKCIKEDYVLNPIYTGLKERSLVMKNNNLFKDKYFNQRVAYNKMVFEDEYEDVAYNLFYRFIRLFDSIHQTEGGIKYKLWFLYQGIDDLDFETLKAQLGEKLIDAHFSSKTGYSFGAFKFNKLEFEISREYITRLPIQNKFKIVSLNENKKFHIKVTYSIFSLLTKSVSKSSKILKIDDKICCYMRQSKRNDLFFTVRPYNKTDEFIENLKINIAYYFSHIYPNKNIILLFEKNSARYEESASVVYEQLIDRKYRNVYFILDENYKDITSIKSKYKKNIVKKYSFKHYLFFFASHKFIGSEALVHAIELRNMNMHVLKKLNSSKNDYIFLQHGVMYMISLDSESRTFFRPRKISEEGKYRVVVSSHLEAQHFIELGGYDASQVIVCGLPKFDKSYMNSDAEYIVIMPTWRPWEYNEASTDFTKTKYYLMLQRIFDNIPKKYHEKVIILPHPLFIEAARGSDFDLKKYMMFDCKYDTILQNTKVLITDYSSIAYDAFYRGCRVIFYWEELNYCLENYGKNTKLMLNRDNVFGDICYNGEDVSKCIENNYSYEQKQVYKDRYSKIVQFHDGKNTQRLINALRQEHIV